MKKSGIIALVITCIIVAAGVGGGTAYIILNQNNKNQFLETSENYNKKDENINQQENDVNNTTTKTNNNYSSNIKTNNESNEKVRKYTHVALQGCVITESNSKTGSVTYKKKCETCGEVQPGTTSTNITSGILNSSFYCPKCKKTQSIKIEATSSYE